MKDYEDPNKVRKENWGIYVLKGMRSVATSTLIHVLHYQEYMDLVNAIDAAIRHIKAKQSLRNPKRKIVPYRNES